MARHRSNMRFPDVCVAPEAATLTTHKSRLEYILAPTASASASSQMPQQWRLQLPSSSDADLRTSKLTSQQRRQSPYTLARLDIPRRHAASAESEEKDSAVDPRCMWLRSVGTEAIPQRRYNLTRPPNDFYSPVSTDPSPVNVPREFLTKTTNRKSSKYCIVDGCTSRAKNSRRCWKHGGSTKCKVSGCSNRAKSKGVCWSHGGGIRCTVDDCETIAVSNGVCWAHGGGKRCRIYGCSKPAKRKTNHLCATHFGESVTATASTARLELCFSKQLICE